MAAILPRNTDGRLSAFAWPGGYAIAYVVDDGALLCATCANRDGHEGGIADGWRLEGTLTADWHDEGEGDWICSHCGAVIDPDPSAHEEGR